MDNLPGPIALLKEAYRTISKKKANLFVMFLLILLFGLVYYLLDGFTLQDSVAKFLFKMILGIDSFIFSIWFIAAMIYLLLDDNIRVGTAFEKAVNKIGPLALLTIVRGFILTLGFLLLIIPGIIWFTKFNFMEFIFLNEDKKRIDPLRESSDYVQSKGVRKVFLRIMFIKLFSLAITWLPIILLVLSPIASTHSKVANLFLFIFIAIWIMGTILFFIIFELTYNYTLYTHLKPKKEPAAVNTA